MAVALALALALSLVVVPAVPAAAKTPASYFDVARARTHVNAVAAIGPRLEGTASERAAADYAVARLTDLGYEVTTQDVPLPDGTTTRNVFAVKAGTLTQRFVIGAHLDGKAGSPAANDNASGVGVVLELARVLKDRRTAPTLVFAFFGAEEVIDGNADHHHYGSRAYVASLSAAQRREISGMISVDMIGYGKTFLVRTMRRGPATLMKKMRVYASRQKVRLVYSRDPSKVGWSDHEPFEKAGIPSAWLEWRTDPVYHTAGDTAAHVQDAKLRTTGRYLERFIAGISRKEVRSLRKR